MMYSIRIVQNWIMNSTKNEKKKRLVGISYLSLSLDLFFSNLRVNEQVSEYSYLYADFVTSNSNVATISIVAHCFSYHILATRWYLAIATLLLEITGSTLLDKITLNWLWRLFAAKVRNTKYKATNVEKQIRRIICMLFLYVQT